MTTLAQPVQYNQGNSSATLPVTISTTAGNALVATITAWMTSNTAVHLVSVSDNASGGSNTWKYSTAANNVSPPAAGAFDAGPGQYAFTAMAYCLPSDNGGTTKAFTTLTVVFSATPTSWSEAGVSEFAGLPAGSVMLASNTSVTLVNGTSYTAPSVSPPGTVLSVVSTSNFGQFTGASSGWSVLDQPDSIAGYDLAASGTIAPTFTLGSAADIPTSAIIAIGVLAVSDVAGAADKTAIAATIPLADAAGAADSAGVAAAVPVGDAAGARDSLGVTAISLPLADAAGAAEAVAVSSSLAVSDVAGAADSVSIIVTVGLSDVGASVQADAIPAETIPLADAAGSDDAIVVPVETIPLPDAAGAADVITVPARTLPLADAAGAAETLAVPAQTMPSGDVAGAAESLAVSVAVGLADEGAAFEDAASGVPVSVADAAAATDGIIVPAATIPLADAAGAADSAALAVALAVADVAGAVEALSVSVAASFGDAGASADRLAAGGGSFAALAAAPVLGAPGRVTELAQASLGASSSLSASALAVRRATAALAAAPVLVGSARASRAAEAALEALPRLTVSAGQGTPSTAALEARPQLVAGATAGPDLEALWAAYMEAGRVAAAKRQQWHMMRQAGGTDGTAGFLYGQAYEAERLEEIAYQAFQAAQRRVHPGVTG